MDSFLYESLTPRSLPELTFCEPLGLNYRFIFVTYIAIVCNINYTPCHYGMDGVFVFAAVQSVFEPTGRVVAAVAAVRGDHAAGWGCCSALSGRVWSGIAVVCG